MILDDINNLIEEGLLQSAKNAIGYTDTVHHATEAYRHAVDLEGTGSFSSLVQVIRNASIASNPSKKSQIESDFDDYEKNYEQNESGDSYPKLRELTAKYYKNKELSKNDVQKQLDTHNFRKSLLTLLAAVAMGLRLVL